MNGIYSSGHGRRGCALSGTWRDDAARRVRRCRVPRRAGAGGGTGAGANADLSFDVDNRFITGEYIALDGHHFKATFGFL
jgi:hypothetical protein